MFGIDGHLPTDIVIGRPLIEQEEVSMQNNIIHISITRNFTECFEKE